MAKTSNMLSLLITISLAVTTMISTAQAQGRVMAPSPFSAGPMSPAGPAGAPGPAGPDCTDSLLNMSSCLTYVEQGSNLTVPEKGCCPGLSGLVNSRPDCLCQLLASGDAFGVKIDITKALMLPTACKVTTPPVSLCSAIGIPVASPMGPSPAPATGGPEEPGFGTPIAPPPNTKSGISRPRATTSTAALIALLAIIAIF